MIFYALTCVGLCFLTPPFQVPDENMHFLRIFQLSEGRIAGVVKGNQTGDYMPASMEWVGLYLQHDIPFHPDVKFDLGLLPRAWNRPLQPDRRRFVGFSNTVLYTPVPYVPQVMVVFLGRIAGLRPLALFYAARLATAATALALLFLAFRVVPPAFRFGFLAAALAPMFLFETASLSVDSLTNAVAFLFIALTARTAFGDGEEPVSRGRLWLLGLLAVVLSLTKSGYALITPVLLLIPRRRVAGLRPYVTFLSLAIGLSFAMTFLWSAYVRPFMAPARPDVLLDPDRQIGMILAEPFRYLREVALNLWQLRRVYWEQTVGQLGWLDAPVPRAAIVVYTAMWLVASFAQGARGFAVGFRARVLLAGIILANMFSIAFLVFLFWTPFGNGVEGELILQGRYLLPLLPLAVILFYNERAARILRVDVNATWFRVVFLVFALSMMAATMHTVWSRYYGG